MDKKPNRFYSNKQEKHLAKELGLRQTANSGATPFDKGDVAGDHVLLEAKTLTKPQKSHSIRKDWLKKNEEEAFSRGKRLSALAFDFGDGDTYVILQLSDFKEMYELWRQEQEK